MNWNNKRTVAILMSTWIGFIFMILHIFNKFSLVSQFLLSFIGYVAIMHIFAPRNTKPPWWRWLDMGRYLGLGVFCIIIYQRITQISFSIFPIG